MPIAAGPGTTDAKSCRAVYAVTWRRPLRPCCSMCSVRNNIGPRHLVLADLEALAGQPQCRSKVVPNGEGGEDRHKGEHTQPDVHHGGVERGLVSAVCTHREQGNCECPHEEVQPQPPWTRAGRRTKLSIAHASWQLAGQFSDFSAHCALRRRRTQTSHQPAGRPIGFDEGQPGHDWTRSRNPRWGHVSRTSHRRRSGGRRCRCCTGRHGRSERQHVLRQAGSLCLRRARDELRRAPGRSLRQLRDLHVRPWSRRRAAAMPLDPEPVAAGVHRVLGGLAAVCSASRRSAPRARPTGGGPAPDGRPLLCLGEQGWQAGFFTGTGFWPT